jgi:hypothetical protein
MNLHNKVILAGDLLASVPDEVVRLASFLPRFDDGRLDYSASPEAAVLDCYIYCEQKLLILKRRNPLGGSGNPWHVVSGFLDEVRPLQDKVTAEVLEEIGDQEILCMHALPPYCSKDLRRWTVYPSAAEITSHSGIQLNEEHSEFAWIPFEAASVYLLPHVCTVWSEELRLKSSC